MAIGFVFGRVVIARAYIRTAPPVGKAQSSSQAGAPAGVLYRPREAQTQTTEEQPATPETKAAPPEATDVTPPDETPVSPAPPETAPQDVRYTVQVGTFESNRSARQMSDRLTRTGRPARIEVDRTQSPTAYRVLTGRYRSESNARKALDQLKNEGFTEAFVVGQ
jgi:cell division protein FtsN